MKQTCATDSEGWDAHKCATPTQEKLQKEHLCSSAHFLSWLDLAINACTFHGRLWTFGVCIVGVVICLAAVMSASSFCLSSWSRTGSHNRPFPYTVKDSIATIRVVTCGVSLLAQLEVSNVVTVAAVFAVLLGAFGIVKDLAFIAFMTVVDFDTSFFSALTVSADFLTMVCSWSTPEKAKKKRSEVLSTCLIRVCNTSCKCLDNCKSWFGHVP